MKVIMFFNPTCSKCMNALSQLDGSSCDVEIVKYLETPPTVAELQHIIQMLGIPAGELVRKKEPVYMQLFDGKDLTDQEWIEAMASYPELIERPILISGNRAIIGREEEKINEFIANSPLM